MMAVIIIIPLLTKAVTKEFKNQMTQLKYFRLDSFWQENMKILQVILNSKEAIQIEI